jgi:hypothetical protein
MQNKEITTHRNSAEARDDVYAEARLSLLV